MKKIVCQTLEKNVISAKSSITVECFNVNALKRGLTEGVCPRKIPGEPCQCYYRITEAQESHPPFYLFTYSLTIVHIKQVNIQRL